MRFLILPLLFLLSVSSRPLMAQSNLEGAWEGTMTVGGIHSSEALPMQLYLTLDGRRVTGRSYVQLPDGSILRMDLSGRVYPDNSISLVETAFAGDAFNDVMPEFNRQYQIVFKADLWDPMLKGYWQEITSETFKQKRRRGRMVLVRAKVKGV